MNTSTPDTSAKKHRAFQLRMPVFVVIVAGCALILWAWKFNRANRSLPRATMMLSLDTLSRAETPSDRAGAAADLAGTPPELAAETIEPLLIAATRDPDPTVREQAIRTLAAVLAGDAWVYSRDAMPGHVDRALPVLAQAIDDPDPKVRAQITTSLGVIFKRLATLRSGKVDGPLKIATAALMKALADPDPTIRVRALRALENLRIDVRSAVVTKRTTTGTVVRLSPDLKIVLPVLESLALHDPDADVRRASIPLILRLDPQPTLIPPTLLTMLRDDPKPAVRAAVIRNLGDLNHHMGVMNTPIPPPDLIVPLAETWSRTNCADFWPPLLHAYLHGTPAEQVEAEHAYLHFNSPPASVHRTLFEALRAETSIPRRRTIVRMIGGIKPGTLDLNDPDIKAGVARLIAIAGDDLAKGNYWTLSEISHMNLDLPELAPLRRAAFMRFRDESNPLEVINMSYMFARFGPLATDLLPDFRVLLRETQDSNRRNAIANILVAIDPDSPEAIPVLVERVEHELQQTRGVGVVWSASFWIDPAAPLSAPDMLLRMDPTGTQLRPLIGPMARYAISAELASDRGKSLDWLSRLFKRNPDLLADSLHDQTDPAIHALLEQIQRELSDDSQEPSP